MEPAGAPRRQERIRAGWASRPAGRASELGERAFEPAGKASEPAENERKTRPTMRPLDDEMIV